MSELDEQLEVHCSYMPLQSGSCWASSIRSLYARKIQLPVTPEAACGPAAEALGA
jgi:hypothetical protein